MALKTTTKTLRADFIAGMKELGLYSKKSRIDPALDPAAQIVNCDGPGETLKALSESLLNSVSQLKKRSEVLYYFALLQMENGLRVSELISVRCSDITVTGSFKIRGKKRSHNRMITGGEAKQYLLKCKGNGVNPFSHLDRFHIRREYLKAGINYYLRGDKKAKVTHIFRHLFVSGMLQSGIEVEEAKTFIGHKSVSSTEQYGKIR